MSNIINELLKKKFSDLRYEDKLQIIQSGRPQPVLSGLKTEYKERNRTYTRCFNVRNYEKYLWLTGSSDSNKLYCWPCLLFSTETGPWNTNGFSSLNYLVTACEKHQKSLGHIRAFTTLQTFGCERIDRSSNTQEKIADNLQNEKENRIVLKKLIDIVAFLGKQVCAVRGHNEPKDSTNKGMYIELLEFLAAYDPLLANHLKTATIKGTSPGVQNDLIDAVASVITDKIREEINKASFVAILLDETTDVTNESQLATVLRYVDDEGNCQERFLHFSDVSLDRTAQGLLRHITKVVDDFDCSKKLIAQTFDGAIVTANHVSSLQTAVKKKYPTAIFIHCYSHRLNLVLSKCTNYIAECKQFFVALSGLSNFFSHSTVRTNALKHFMERKHPAMASVKWNFSSQLVNTVKDHRDHLIEFFTSIEDEPGDWTGEEMNTASGFIRFLSKLDTKFFLIIFHKIFMFSDVLHDVLQNKSMDIFYYAKQVNAFYAALKKIKDEDFDQVWIETIGLSCEKDEENEPRSKLQKTDDDRSEYLCIFNEILGTLLTQTRLRFESLKYLRFVALLNSNRFDEFCENFPEHLLAELRGPYASSFDALRLKNELKVFYSLNEYKNKSVRDILYYMKLNKLDIVYSEVYKLAELTLTFPLTTATTEKSSSATKRIKMYLRATQGQVRLNNLALLSIEKNVLLNMKTYSEETFYENVMLKFTQKERRMGFIYQ